MPLPASFAKSGFVSAAKLRPKRKLMIGTDGPAGTGKSEFAHTAPGPGLAVLLDRCIDSVLDNPNLSMERLDNWGYQTAKVPLATVSNKKEFYLEYWKTFYDMFKAATDNPDARTLFVDGDSDSWELQRLAEFGRLTQIPSIMYTNVNAARRAMYARACDCGKIIIMSNKVTENYADKLDAKGNVMVSDSGKEIRVPDGTFRRQGFGDMEYLWNIHLRHMYKLDKKGAGTWGIKILMCKANKELEGVELWGNQCNFASLVQTVYPQVPLEEWGF